jgi:hypothetical protein
LSDYTITTDFSVKDALPTGDAEKLILGSDVDVELEAIKTAIATKYDSADLASQAQAEAESANTVLMTPLRIANWADENGGLVGEIQELADPGADGLVGWDDSASANANVVYFTAGTALALSGTTIEVSHLGIEDLADPGADRVLFWDDSASKTDWATLGGELEFTTTTLQMNIDGATDLNVTPAYNDEFIISDGGTTKKIDISACIQPPESTKTDNYTLVIGDAGSVIRMNSASNKTVTVPPNSSVAFLSDAIIAVERYGSGTCTIAAGSGVTIRSPGAVLAISLQYGRVVMRKIATDEWVLDGRL